MLRRPVPLPGAGRRRADDGFTLIELLVVIIIIGILAAIAVPYLISKRDRAVRAAMASDLRSTALLMETYYTDYESYPADFSQLTETPHWSADDTVSLVSTSGSAYCLSVTNTKVAGVLYYSSSGGGLLPRGTSCS